MKKNIFKFIMLSLLFVVAGCQEPEELLPPVSREGVNSITATFADGTGNFVGYLEEGSNEIIIPIPYYFPENSNNQVTAEQMSNMRIKANLDDNVTIEPSILYMNLNEENYIIVTDQLKREFNIMVTGKIRKSSNAFIEAFKLPTLGLSGVINENTKTVSLISVEQLEAALAEVDISAHASISPDPALEALDYNEGVELTVTAHDGVTQNTYTVIREIPSKLPYGIRPGSAKLLFAKKLKADLGISVDNLTGGIAVTDDYIIVNTRGQNSIMLDARTGEQVGEIELGAVKGSLVNFYSTADDDGNILINNLAPNAGSFKLWSLASVEDAPQVYIEWDGGLPVGRKVSVIGSLDADAIITAPILQAGQQFARWTVVGGMLISQTPEIVTMTGLVKGWGTNVDIVYSSPSDVTSDYFVASYSDNSFAWVDGMTNKVNKTLDPLSANYITNAVDYIEFNNASYATLNWVNSFNWGSADGVWLLDVTSDVTFEGDLSDNTSPAIVWSAPFNTYGGKSVSPVIVNANGTGDVALTKSDDGYYLNLYFMFTNGYVVGYQFDAIDI